MASSKKRRSLVWAFVIFVTVSVALTFEVAEEFYSNAEVDVLLDDTNLDLLTDEGRNLEDFQTQVKMLREGTFPFEELEEAPTTSVSFEVKTPSLQSVEKSRPTEATEPK